MLNRTVNIFVRLLPSPSPTPASRLKLEIQHEEEERQQQQLKPINKRSLVVVDVGISFAVTFKAQCTGQLAGRGSRQEQGVGVRFRGVKRRGGWKVAAASGV